MDNVLPTVLKLPTSPNMMCKQIVNPNINILSLPFDNALPYWIEAFDNSMITIETHLADYDEKDKLIETIKMLCHPDPRQRGHKKNIAQKHGSNFSLERFVESFNLLARRAEYKLTK